MLDNDNITKKIIIYPHTVFDLANGGVTVQYYLAEILSKYHKDVYIYNVHDNNKQNDIYNKFITLDDINKFNKMDFVVIYCEGVIGNPLNAVYVVRWLLSKVGQNVPLYYYNTWDSNELVYFFNTEKELIDNNFYYKCLSLLYVNPKLDNLNQERNEYCHTYRKQSKIYKDLNIKDKIEKNHPDNSFLIDSEHNQEKYNFLELFNSYKYFISYDPLTFLSYIAALCGCISIIYPIPGITKKDYYKMTCLYDYMIENKIENIFGVAYGKSEEEISFAEKTNSLLKEQIKEIQNWQIEKYVKTFIKDIHNWDKNLNKLSYYKNIILYNIPDISFDFDFYKKLYSNDFSNGVTVNDVANHYLNIGKKEGRIKSQEHACQIVNDKYFDIFFYRDNYNDVKNIEPNEVLNQYILFGKKTGRICSKEHIIKLIGDDRFDIDFYIEHYPDLQKLPIHEIVNHYIVYGKKEGRIGSKKEMLEIVKKKDFNITLYRVQNPNLNQMNLQQVLKYFISKKNIKNKDTNKDNNIDNNKDNNKIDEEKVKKNKILNPKINSPNEETQNIKDNSILHLKNTHIFNHNFYKKYYKDLQFMSDEQLFDHYINYGKKEGKIGSNELLIEMVKDRYFDIDFYIKHNYDLQKLPLHEVVYHYINYGKKEGRLPSLKHVRDFIGDKYFDIEFIKKNYYPMFENMKINEMISYYKENHIKKKILSSLNKIYELTGDSSFDIDFYKKYNNDTIKLNLNELVNYYLSNGKQNNHITNYNRFYKLTSEQNFDINFYKDIYPEIKNMDLESLIQDYNINGKKENRLVSKTQLYNIIGRKIDITFYREIYPEIKNMKLNELIQEYQNIGIKQNRILTKEEFYNLIGNNIFDINFYKNNYTEISNLNIKDIIEDYLQNGIKENRIICDNHFNNYIKENEIDFEFVKYLYDELKYLTDTEILNYHKLNNDTEKLIVSKNYFYKLNPYFDFNDYINISNIEIDVIKYYIFYEMENQKVKNDIKNININNFYNVYNKFSIEYYKLFNKELIGFNNDELLQHYYSIGKNVNKDFFKYDCIISDKFINTNLNDNLNNLIYNHSYFRSINTREKLIFYRKKYEKKYFIYNEKSFYKYYKDFNYEYYKNRYFKNIYKPKIEILMYYHLVGKYKREITNDTKNIIIYIPPLDIKCGGILVVHYFAQLINTKYKSYGFRAKLFMLNNIKYDNPFCNDFADIYDITDNSIVIYPEIVYGNPLKAKNVVRWILLELGIEMPIDHYKNWGKNNLIYHWESITPQLACPFYNNIFKNNNTNGREKTCYLRKKGHLLHKTEIKYIHPHDSICIDSMSLLEINEIFNNSKYFYTYDPNSAYIIYAAVCGCIPIIYEIDGISEDEYFKSKMFNFNNVIYNKGIVYGNNIDKIKYILDHNLNNNNEAYYRNLFRKLEEYSIPNFLKNLSFKN